MGRLLSLVRGVECSIRSRLGAWMQEVSTTTDQAVIDIAALQAAQSNEDWKDSVAVAITSALPAFTQVGNTITFDAAGALPAQDGVAIVTTTPPQRVLLAIGTDPSNGIWDVIESGGADPAVLERSSDADTSADVTSAMRVPIATGGTDHGGKVFRLATNDPIVLNTTALTYVEEQGLPDGTASGQVATWDGSAWTFGILAVVPQLQVGAGAAPTTEKLRINGTANVEQLIVNTIAGATTDIQTWRRNNVVVADITATGAIEANAISFQNGLDTPGGGGIVAEMAGGALVLTCGPFGTGYVVAQPAAAGALLVQPGAVTTHQLQFDTTGISLLNAKDIRWKDTGGTFRTVMRGDSANIVDLVSMGVGFTFRTSGFGAISVQLYETGEFDIVRGPIRGQFGAKASIVLQSNATKRFEGNSDGLAFYAGTPRAQPTIAGSLSTVADASAKAVLTSIIAALAPAAGVNLVIDGTT